MASGSIYTIPGVASGQPATLQVSAWRGKAASFDASDPREDWFWPVGVTKFIFTNPTGGTEPASLDGMPAMWKILDVPEPPAMALIAVGIAMAALSCGLRRKAQTSQ
jgi:hypothetical protein